MLDQKNIILMALISVSSSAMAEPTLTDWIIYGCSYINVGQTGIAHGYYWTEVRNPQMRALLSKGWKIENNCVNRPWDEHGWFPALFSIPVSQSSMPQKQIGTPSTQLSCPSSLKGNPINFAIGNKTQNEQDLRLAELSLTRTYNSYDGAWSHSYSTRLWITGAQITLIHASGRQSFFTNYDNRIKSEPDEFGILKATTEGFSYSSSDGETYFFDQQGRLTKTTHPQKETQTLSYIGSMIQVSDESGHTLSFEENTAHQLLSATDGAHQISYSYNGNRLTAVTQHHGDVMQQRLYHYENSSNPNLLTGITDERGIRYATWTYDDQGRAISSEHAGGAERTLVSYNADGSSTITNALGKRTTYRFQTIQGVRRITAIEGEPSTNCPNSNSTFTYDDRGLVKTRTDNKGNITTFDYNERGLEVSRTEAFGTPQARTVTTEWHPTLFLPVIITEPDRTTSYSYDVQGRMIGQATTQR
ncbi:DUF6531 domain-containing protein [Pseudomonas sp. Pc102]|uniref:DUF6531 domain-containing protein n=1 Tax=Pseudomonas sp. Pc102 TaxID=2678261 RepID=UPI001FD268A9|nr:DUF6531 domain-containing protein [Pseudomonas sp. Pc102]